MNANSLVVGAELPRYRVSARMPIDPVENKIHEDELARAMGFRGGLVPGVTVYAWMTHPIVEALGTSWLEGGTFSVRFTKPVYFDEQVTVCASAAGRTEASMTLEARVLDAEGETCATATMGLPLEPAPPAPDVNAYPAAPLPAERPQVSRALLERQTILGTPELVLDEPAAQAFLERVSERLPIYRGPAAPAHPGLFLDLANRALSRNVRVSPWIHVESQGRHVGLARVGERLVELDILLVAGGTRPIASNSCPLRSNRLLTRARASIRHVAIYQLRGSVA